MANSSGSCKWQRLISLVTIIIIVKLNYEKIKERFVFSVWHCRGGRKIK